MTDMSKIPYVPGQFDKEEELAFEQFKKFATYLPNIYHTYTGTPSGNRIDVRGNNITGGCECIELKKRSFGADGYQDCFIEPEKYNALMGYWEEDDCFPIYINFIGDWKNVYVFYLPEIEKFEIHKNVYIKHQNGLHSTEDRYGLYFKDAHHYIYDNETDSYKETKPVNPRIINRKAKKNEETGQGNAEDNC